MAEVTFLRKPTEAGFADLLHRAKPFPLPVPEVKRDPYSIGFEFSEAVGILAVGIAVGAMLAYASIVVWIP